MGWDGSGGFDRLYNWQTDKSGGIKVRADRMDDEFDNYATGLENCITRDGQNSPTQNLPMGSRKHTDVANGTARNEYAAVGQLQDGAMVYGAAGGSADAQTLSLSPAIPAYSAGQVFRFSPTANNTGACTLDVNGLGAKPVKLVNGSDPAAGDIDSSGIAEVVYNGTVFVLMNPVSFINTVLTSPVINDGVSGTAVDTDSSLANNSDTLLASQKAIKGYVDSRTVILDGQVNIVSSLNTVETSGWVTVNAGAPAGARFAVLRLKVYTELSSSSSATSSFTALYVRNGGSSSSIGDSTERVYVANTVKPSSSYEGKHGQIEIIIGLDVFGNFDFWRSGADGSVSGVTSTHRIDLSGYII